MHFVHNLNFFKNIFYNNFYLSIILKDVSLVINQIWYGLSYLDNKYTGLTLQKNDIFHKFYFWTI